MLINLYFMLTKFVKYSSRFATRTARTQGIGQRGKKRVYLAQPKADWGQTQLGLVWASHRSYRSWAQWSCWAGAGPKSIPIVPELVMHMDTQVMCNIAQHRTL
jgi:hypothetical protein